MNHKKNFSDYCATLVDTDIEGTSTDESYILNQDNYKKTIKYAEYLAENLDKTISYCEYLAEQFNKLVDYVEEQQKIINSLSPEHRERVNFKDLFYANRTTNDAERSTRDTVE